MSVNRVQKLLFSEYCDFEDLVLIESPFAQTTKDGKGLRQVHIGLTPSKLILAADILPPVDDPRNVLYNPFVDPEIETFELIAIYPVECVNLSVYRRKRRQAIKARFCNNRVLYFELGGFERRGMFWNLWCEKVKFLCPGDSGTSRSETSVATSTTGSSLYLVDRKAVTVNGVRQLWCKFGPNFAIDTHFVNEVVAGNGQSLVRKWTDRYLYLGKDLHETTLDYKPIVKLPYIDEFVKPKKTKKKCRQSPLQRTGETPKLMRQDLKAKEHPSLAEEKNLPYGSSVQVNRFGSGILEGCRTGLYLTLDDYVVPRRYSSTVVRETSSEPSLDWRSFDCEELAETAVLLWEYYAFRHLEDNFRKVRHRRRYGFAPKPFFLYGLGPWQVTGGDRFSLQLKRATSDICIGNSSNTSDERKRKIKLPLAKQQLVSSASCPIFGEEGASCKCNNFINGAKKPLTFFWTPGYWYRPISVRDSYKQQQKHLKRLHEWQEANAKRRRRRCGGKRFLRRFNIAQKDNESDEENDEDSVLEAKKRKHSGFISNLLHMKFDDETKRPNETPLQHLKRMCKNDLIATAWDFDSTTLAQQLTLIDKELFLKISPIELSVLLWQQSSRNAPNVSSMIAFSYRISCLIASEILRDDSEKIRARLMARFINVASKCHRTSNFHSCRTVLGGLQSPAVFRLRRTWAYVRKKHASKYQAFEFLCRLYRDPRMPSFQKTFYIFSQHPPFLPYIGHVIAKLFDKVPEYRIQTYKRPASRQLSFCTSNSFRSCSSRELVPKQQPANIFAKLFSVFVHPTEEAGGGDAAAHKPKKSPKTRKTSVKSVKFRGLYEYFKPPYWVEDNRERALAEAVELLEKCQLGAVQYNFSVNEIARNFLLKARHYDDQDNFYRSLNLEQTRSDNFRNKND